MKILVDTNVALDVLLERHPFSEDSFAIFRLANLKRIKGILPAASITDIFYIARKQRRDTEEVYHRMDKLTALFSVAPVSETTIANALALRWKDFEDAVQYMAATENSVDYIVTRNTQDFSSSHIPAVTPEQFMRIIADR
ncbi:MAG: PIN domain-containing protein [Treponema sp.]|jgi:predicted nucleic acid-binding protein|nr:PIN domain-containing protein [Treponema sp.]